MKFNADVRANKKVGRERVGEQLRHIGVDISADAVTSCMLQHIENHNHGSLLNYSKQQQEVLAQDNDDKQRHRVHSKALR
jgi:hypothetical protein